MVETQKHRIVEVRSPLADDVLLLRSMSGYEELGRLFSYDLELCTKDYEIDLNDILGQPMTVVLELEDGGNRYFNGVVSQLSEKGYDGEYSVFHAILQPWIWFLTRTKDCKIFQGKNVPDIVKSVFRDFGFSDFEDNLSRIYSTLNYCVQYRESSFDFVSRLLEQEGIYYYFKHENGKHTLILADSFSAHDVTENYEKIAFYPPSHDLRRETEHIFSWSCSLTVQSGVYVLNDFDFERPAAKLIEKRSIVREHSGAEFEVYDYPGEYTKNKDGEHYVKSRIEELQARHQQYYAEANARGVSAGNLFTLSGYPRMDQNKEYLVTSVNYQLTSNIIALGTNSDAASEFICNFVNISTDEVYRSERSTPKPIVKGPQTATVVGKSGEEIWTDKHARVKLQFHWDRYGESDENSSCWIRVAQLWAGAKWGSIHIPRIGQEVIVEFLEGDPDRPIVTGRVYNGANMPPYDLPTNVTQSGIKSRSTKDGKEKNYNEIRMEDKIGEEQLYIHAEYNQDNVVENDETTLVENDRNEEVKNDEEIKIGNDRTLTVGNNQILKVGKNLTIDVGDKIIIKTGQAKIIMKKDGTIKISGSDISIDAKGKIEQKAAATLTLKGSQILQN